VRFDEIASIYFICVSRLKSISSRIMLLCSVLKHMKYKSKGKVFPYSLPSVGPGADPGVQAVSPQVTWSESRHRLAVGCRYFLPACGYLSCFHQMALPVNGSTHLIPASLLIYRPRKDERSSWPSWLTYSGWLTHISGHPSAAGRAQDRESSPARDRRYTNCATPPTKYKKCLNK